MEQRNLMLAVVISIAVLLGWQFLFEKPRIEKEMAARKTAQTTQQAAGKPGVPQAPAPGAGAPAAPAAGVPSAPPAPSAPQAPGIVTPTPPGAGTQVPTTPGVTPRPAAAVRTEVLRHSPRVQLSSPRLHGSIRLAGGQFDDLTLADYRETTDRNSPEIVLLTPAGTERPYFVQFGWVAAEAGISLPGETTGWTASSGTLMPGKPVTLSWDNGQGLLFERTVSVDENYVFSVTQKVRNTGTKPVTLYPYGLVSRTGTPATQGFYLLHEGMLGVLNNTLKEIDYEDMRNERKVEGTTTGGWLGITDKYWLVALLPDQKVPVQAAFRYSQANKADKYQADYLGGAQTVAPGGTSSVTNRLFAGAKEVKRLDSYEEKLGIARFDLAVDFGWFYFLTKPIFYVLDFFALHLGNFGLAILLLTVLIKAAFFPLANKSYEAMSKLKKLQPKMTELRDRYKDDRAKMNEAMMRLYKEEKANPASGCLPIMVQIPVFFALYKVLFVSIEMRHAPFYGWIHDLSAPDPTSLLTLFGLIPWTPPEILQVLNVGVWPILMGITMWLQQKLNPAPADPTQAKIMMFLPLVFTFMLAQFPAGLVIYWAWNNLLSISQQWLIMRRMGVKVT
jgi:YidC/Oxa1 family membrane protein insertase